MNPFEAKKIAFIAHTACGQFRADGETPYIVHPIRVAELTERFFHTDVPKYESLNDLLVCAYLHDVVEDTKLSFDDLKWLGANDYQLDLIERLTKRAPDKPAPPEYYERIAQSPGALIVKCADRCANLEDALQAVEETSEVQRWANYMSKSARDMVPMYRYSPRLQAELQQRLDAIARALPAAIARRFAIVERERAAAGRHSWVWSEDLARCTRCDSVTTRETIAEAKLCSPA